MKSYMLKILWLFLFVFLFNACSTVELPPDTTGTGQEQTVAREPFGDYRMMPGDEIEIKFFYHPDLNEKLTIGPDGKISLQFIDEILVAGLTTSQLDEILTEKYAYYLENCIVSVMVREYSGLRIYVGGEVVRPGFVSLKGKISILQAILSVEGFKDTAKPEKILLIRRGPGNAPIAMPIDLGPVISGERLENDLYLMPSDIIYVPKTWVGMAGQFADQHLRKLLFLDQILSGLGYTLGSKWAGGLD